MQTEKNHWEKSYQRKENHLFYPKEEAVKFINRYIKKKLSTEQKFKNILKSSNLRGLDFGCGIGRLSILLKEFEIDCYGIDISTHAINTAKKLAINFGFDMDDKLVVFDGDKIEFKNDFFHFTICDGVLDSIRFTLAKKLINEISRVTKHLCYLTLISTDSMKLFKKSADISKKELVVSEKHEFGTIQSFYDFEKISHLIEQTNFRIKTGEIITHKDIFDKNNFHSRYHLVLEKY